MVITIASRYESFIGCSSYTFLNESNRAVTNYNRSIFQLCDSNFTGWYRFSGEAGTQMAESCANKHYCGTDAPGWLSGGHPAVIDGNVKRKVCFSSFGQCCYYSNFVTVKNCGGFYVYKLERPPKCNLRYCGSGLPYAQGTLLHNVCFHSYLFSMHYTSYTTKADHYYYPHCHHRNHLFKRATGQANYLQT